MVLFHARLAATGVAVLLAPPIGTLPIGGSLNDVLDGPVFREIRRQLLTGELNEHCRQCPVRPLTAPETLRNHLLDELAKDASQ
jgi:hypothetical protein